MLCADCEDFLFVFENAIPLGKTYSISEYFSYVICQQKTNSEDDYILRFIKEYRQIENHKFHIHENRVTEKLRQLLH